MIAHPSKIETPKLDLVPINLCLTRLGHSNLRVSRQHEMISRYGIKILSEMPYGRGSLRMMSRAQMEELIQKHRPAALDSSAEEEASTPELHLGALETKIDRLEETLRGNTQAINELIKSTNIFADKLAKVLSQLGVS